MKVIARALSALALVAMLSTFEFAAAQNPVAEQSALRHELKTARESGEWDRAIAAADALLAVNALDGELWVALAKSAREAGRYERAISAYRSALEIGFVDRPEGLMEIARLHALNAEPDRAVEHVGLSVDAGYRWAGRIAGDPAFADLADNAQFKALAGERAPLEDRGAAWRADLDHLIQEVRRTHYVYRNRDLPAAFEREAQRFRENIDAWSNTDAFFSMQKMLASLGDGHSLAYPFGSDALEFHAAPVQTYWFSDGLYVVDSAVDPERMVGRRVAQIGSLDPETLRERLRPYISDDNAMTELWQSPGYMTISELLLDVGAVASTETVPYTLVSPNGDRDVVNVPVTPLDPSILIRGLPAVGGADTPAYLSRPGAPFWRTSISDDIMYVQFNAVLNADDQSISAFAAELKNSAEAGVFRKLIIDVRRNRGGEGTLLYDLLRTLYWFDEEHGPNTIVVITGRSTFSAAQIFVTHLDYFSRARFVGEATGSRPIHVGDEAPFRLPHSGIIGQIASGLHKDAPTRDGRHWIAPDVNVAYASSDYFEGADPMLDAAIALLTEE